MLKKKAFTLIEVIVILAIIGIITAGSIVAYNEISSKSRDKKRVSDVLRIQQALELYHRDEGFYPETLSFGAPLIGSTSDIVYLTMIPQSPSRNDGSCLASTTPFVYTYTSSTDSYILQYCLGGKVAKIDAGLNCAYQNGINGGQGCATNQIAEGGGGTNPPGFCLLHPESCSWALVGQESFSGGNVNWTSLSFNDAGVPYVAYIDFPNDPPRLSIMRFSNGWDYVGERYLNNSVPILRNTEANHPSLYVYNNTPYVAFTKVFSPTSGDGKLIKFDGTSWVQTGNDYTDGVNAAYNVLSFYNNEPYVAYFDSGGTNKISVRKYNGSDWNYIGTQDFSGTAIRSSFSISDTGIPYVAYVESPNSGISVMKYENSSWSYVGGANFMGNFAATEISIDIDNNGQPYIAYEQANEIFVMKFNGSTWEYVSNSTPIASGSNSPSLYINNNVPYVAYDENASGTKVQRFVNNAWETVGTFGQGGIYNSLKFYNDTPYVSFKNSASPQGATLKQFIVNP
jgi:prepilin-type N-terminal cleavage/methylation domain-containing protein